MNSDIRTKNKKKMTKINKSNLTLRCKRIAKNALLKTNKLTVKRMKLAVCDETHEPSSDDDQLPMLPSTSSSSSTISSNLSPIEEEKLSSSVSTLTTSSSSESEYMSSFLFSSITSISNISEDGIVNYNEFYDTHNQKIDPSTSAENKVKRSEPIEIGAKTSSKSVEIIIDETEDASVQCDENQDPHHYTVMVIKMIKFIRGNL